MTDINNVQNAQNALLEKLGIKTTAEVNKEKNSNTLGQEDFLRLMTTQLQNQDPFAPMENGDFIAQMAQFSSVTGINKMSSALAGIGDQFKQMRIAMATNVLGHSVLAPGNIAKADENGELHGVLDINRASIQTSVSFSDATTGELLKVVDLGAQPSGLIGFEWKDLPDDYKDGTKKILVSAMVNNGSGPENIQPSIFAKVIGTEIDKNNHNIKLNLGENGLIDADSVLKFKL
tara:strand:- start:2555 stop:3253 length:699 start_codon:yes stop_codon:yes gene_type:complete